MQRKQHWEEIYQQKQPDEVSWFQSNPEFSLALIQAAGIAQTQAVIDVGGGASGLVDALLEAGYADVTVLDIAAAALRHTQLRLGERAARVHWQVADVTTFVPPRQYALWHDRAVFHFLTDPAERGRYLAVLKQALTPDGHVIIATFALDGPLQCSGLPVERYDAAKLQHILGEEFQLQQVRHEAHHTPGGKIQQFNYFSLRKAA